MAVWRGSARVTTTTGGLIGATRWWMLATGNTDDTDDRSVWEATTGSQVTVHFRTGTTGATPPSGADAVRLEVRRSDGSVLKTLHNSAPPANGASFTFDLTDTGDPGGTERGGALELYVQAEFDGITGDYNVDSQSNAVVGNITQWARGLIVSNSKVSAISVSAYPAGSAFAYGTAGDEIITATVTHTQPFVANQGQLRLDALDGAAVQASGTAKAISGTQTQQTFIANNTFDDTLKSYGIECVSASNAFLTPDSGAVLWSKLVSVGLEQNGDNVRRQSFYSVDPRITFGAPTLGQSVYNRGEATTIDVQLTNARGEALTRSVSFVLKDSTGATKQSSSDTGANYDVDYSLTSSDDADDSLAGKQWTLHTNQADVDSNPQVAVFSVSTYRALHSQASLPVAGDPSSADNAVNASRAGKASNTVLNHGQSVVLSGYIFGVRGNPWPFASGQTLATVNEAGTVESTHTPTINTSTGAFSLTYTPPLNGDHAPGALSPQGAPGTDAKHLRLTSTEGNAQRDSQDAITLHNGLSLVQQWAGKSNADADADGNPDLGASASFFVGADVMYSKVQVADAAGDGYDDAAITSATVIDGVVEDTKTGAVSQTEASYQGWQDLFYAFQVVAPAGERSLRNDAVRGGNAVRDTLTVSYAPSYTGNLSLVPVARTLIDSPETVRVYIVPRVYDQVDGVNTPRLLSESNPVATLDDVPRYVVWEHDGSVAPTPLAAASAASRVTANDDDVWYLDFTAGVGKTYTVEVVATISGGQCHDRVYISGDIPDRFDAVGIFK